MPVKMPMGWLSYHIFSSMVAVINEQKIERPQLLRDISVKIPSIMFTFIIQVELIQVKYNGQVLTASFCL